MAVSSGKMDGSHHDLADPSLTRSHQQRAGRDGSSDETGHNGVGMDVPAGETDVRAETLEKAAEVLTLRQDAIQFIDGEPQEEGKPGPETELGEAGTASA